MWTGLKMQIVLHAGAHVTDEDRLIACLTENRELLAGHGTHVPAPGRYRKLIRDLFREAQQTGLPEDARDRLHEAIAADGGNSRIVLSNAGFFGTPKMAASGGELYTAAEMRLRILQQLLPRDRIEIFLAICNPATFLPTVFRQTSFDNIEDYLKGADPAALRWSDMLRRIRDAFPDLPITVWCNEDSPLIWAQVVREIAGLDPTVAIEGEFALLAEIMTETGMQRFESYLKSHPGMTEVQKRRVIAAFLDKFVREEAIEEELDLPGWTEELVARLSDLYDDDLFEIQRIPGVTLITP